jgi:hypothetical protein
LSPSPRRTRRAAGGSKGGKSRAEKFAMAAGVETYPWSVTQLAELLD